MNDSAWVNFLRDLIKWDLHMPIFGGGLILISVAGFWALPFIPNAVPEWVISGASIVLLGSLALGLVICVWVAPKFR